MSGRRLFVIWKWRTSTADYHELCVWLQIDEAAATKRVKWDMQDQGEDDMEEQAAEDKQNAERHDETEREDAERIREQQVSICLPHASTH